MHLNRQSNCWSLRCSWSIACRRCSNYIFILNLKPGFNGLGTDNYKTRRETFMFWDWVHLILESWRYLHCLLWFDPCGHITSSWWIHLIHAHTSPCVSKVTLVNRGKIYQSLTTFNKNSWFMSMILGLYGTACLDGENGAILCSVLLCFE